MTQRVTALSGTPGEPGVRAVPVGLTPRSAHAIDNYRETRQIADFVACAYQQPVSTGRHADPTDVVATRRRQIGGAGELAFRIERVRGNRSRTRVSPRPPPWTPALRDRRLPPPIGRSVRY